MSSSAPARLAQLEQHLTGSVRGLLAGQNAIITGSAQGIGAACAELFAAAGASVVIADLDEKKSQAVAAKITSSGGRALAVAGDITSQSYIDTLVKQAAAFGNGKIHIVVNNAGYTYDGVIHKMSDAQWDAIINIHNTAPFKLIRACSPYFRVEDGEPRNIINISSTSGVNGNAGQANYGTAKAGVTGLTKVICKEWGPKFGVRANTVGFGRIDTRLTRSRGDGEFVTTPDGTKVPLGIPASVGKGDAGLMEIPLRRAGSPMEAAASILMIASPLASYVSGQTIMVTGGRNA